MLKFRPDLVRQPVRPHLVALKLVAPMLTSLIALTTSPVHAGLFSPRHPRITREATRLGDWRLDIARDPFAGSIACRLRSSDHHAFYRSGAVAFRFKRKWDVDEAVYRLDGGEPRRFRDDLPDLISRGAPVDRGPLGNAEEGIVWVPYANLTMANRITIEPRRDRTPRDFHFRGLVALHDIAVARGCHPESRFIE